MTPKLHYTMAWHHSQIRCDIWINNHRIPGVLCIAWPQIYPTNKLGIAEKSLFVSYNTSKILLMISLDTQIMCLFIINSNIHKHCSNTVNLFVWYAFYVTDHVALFKFKNCCDSFKDTQNFIKMYLVPIAGVRRMYIHISLGVYEFGRLCGQMQMEASVNISVLLLEYNESLSTWRQVVQICWYFLANAHNQISCWKRFQCKDLSENILLQLVVYDEYIFKHNYPDTLELDGSGNILKFFSDRIHNIFTWLQWPLLLTWFNFNRSMDK